MRHMYLYILAICTMGATCEGTTKPSGPVPVAEVHLQDATFDVGYGVHIAIDNQRKDATVVVSVPQ